MATVTFTISDALVTELNQIAVKAGFTNTKQMVIAYLRATIRASRGNLSIVGIREAAELQANQDTVTIS